MALLQRHTTFASERQQSVFKKLVISSVWTGDPGWRVDTWSVYAGSNKLSFVLQGEIKQLDQSCFNNLKGSTTDSTGV